MPYMKRPQTAEQYVEMIEQAIVEVQEMRASLEYDMEGADAQQDTILEPLERALTQLRQSMADGDYHFENKDLPFMDLVKRYRSKLPIAELLATINRTHREGLDANGED